MSGQLRSGDEISRLITERLETCRTAAGFETDLGREVYRGRLAVDARQVPCAAIIEGNQTLSEADGRTALEVRILQEYVVLAYVPCDIKHPNDAAHQALRDVRRALFVTNGKPDRTLGDKVKRLMYRGHDIGPRADGAAFVVAQVILAVEFVEMLAEIPG